MKSFLLVTVTVAAIVATWVARLVAVQSANERASKIAPTRSLQPGDQVVDDPALSIVLRETQGRPFTLIVLSGCSECNYLTSNQQAAIDAARMDAFVCMQGLVDEIRPSTMNGARATIVINPRDFLLVATTGRPVILDVDLQGKLRRIHRREVWAG